MEHGVILALEFSHLLTGHHITRASIHYTLDEGLQVLLLQEARLVIMTCKLIILISHQHRCSTRRRLRVSLLRHSDCHHEDGLIFMICLA